MPLKTSIARHIPSNIVNAIAGEQVTGLPLKVATVNFDAGRSAVWNIGANL